MVSHRPRHFVASGDKRRVPEPLVSAPHLNVKGRTYCAAFFILARYRQHKNGTRVNPRCVSLTCLL
jgi:hypothetical protein